MELCSLKPDLEDIRLDEETVLKTVGGLNRFGVRVPGLPLSTTQPSPVAQRRRQLSYKQTIDGSSPPGTIEADWSPEAGGRSQ